MKTVIGIDPGLAETGIGLVTGRGMKIQNYSFGHIVTRKTDNIAVRLDLIHSKIKGIIDTHKPDLMVVEDVFSLERYPKSGILLGKVIGVVLLAAAHAGVPAVEIPVRESKKILSGNGNAAKDQLEKAVRCFLNHGEPIRPYHASDALALALIGLFRQECS
jgi:crossover junction endodeoxyribonuclease RuvC